jgi:hypothetical protein
MISQEDRERQLEEERKLGWREILKRTPQYITASVIDRYGRLHENPREPDEIISMTLTGSVEDAVGILHEPVKEITYREWYRLMNYLERLERKDEERVNTELLGVLADIKKRGQN